jgi:hypothetical protein
MQAADGPDLANRSDFANREVGGGFRSFTPTQAFFLARLQDLIARRQQQASQVAADDWRLRLLDKAMYSTFRDCVDLGVGDDARALLRRQTQAEQS